VRLLLKTTAMMTRATVTMIPAIDIAIDARPNFLAPTGSDTAVLLACTTHKVHTTMMFTSARAKVKTGPRGYVFTLV